MRLSFTKMHGCGNDFVVIDAMGDLQNWTPSAHDAAFLLDRHRGVGGDQLLILYPSKRADARMAIFNADGSEVEMCGNGIRCCALFMRRRGLTTKKALTIETLAGMIKPVIEGERVRVDMGAPRLDAHDIPVMGYTGRVVGAHLLGIRVRGSRHGMTCVSMGNPHAVFFVDDVAAVPLADLGPKIEHHPAFPRRTNVEFAQVLGHECIRMRVWERGAGVTLACGTGACATAVAAMLHGLVGRTVAVELEGGEMEIAWPDEKGSVFMAGPAAEVFKGTMAWETA